MINLLNPNQLKQIRAARVNVRLRRFLISTVLTLVGIGGVYAVGYKISTDGYTTAQNDNTIAQSTLANYATVKKEAESYQSNLSIAKKILGGEIVFSNFMINVAKILPPNTVLDSLTLTTKPTTSSKTKPGSTQIKARAKSYADVLTLKSRLEDSDIFSDVRIASTTTPNTTKGLTGTDLTYQFFVTYDVVIDKASGAQP